MYEGWQGGFIAGHKARHSPAGQIGSQAFPRATKTKPKKTISIARAAGQRTSGDTNQLTIIAEAHPYVCYQFPDVLKNHGWRCTEPKHPHVTSAGADTNYEAASQIRRQGPAEAQAPSHGPPQEPTFRYTHAAARR